MRRWAGCCRENKLAEKMRTVIDKEMFGNVKLKSDKNGFAKVAGTCWVNVQNMFGRTREMGRKRSGKCAGNERTGDRRTIGNWAGKLRKNEREMDRHMSGN